jgi:hypothetical protein
MDDSLMFHTCVVFFGEQACFPKKQIWEKEPGLGGR